ncbi:hypothetical protein M426DRAFT_316998 [Hypoxylon sp. CI-4A]|nr:hypothetical protein M426DRAFT_316998 [Hypoxylon sp. CI-4A]
MAPTVVLISGANRGLGKGLLADYLARPNHTVVAFNRNPDHPTSKSLAELPKGQDSKLIVVKVDATVESDAAEGIKALSAQGVDHLDVVIANAAIAYIFPKVRDITTKDLQAHMTPNLYGVVWLMQAALPLLKKAPNPKWITIGSIGGKLENQLDLDHAAYSPTKVAVHWMTKRLDKEEPWLTSMVIHPGFVDTDMAGAGADGFGESTINIGWPLVPVAECSAGILKVIDEATKESHGGGFWAYNGQREGW